MERIIERRGRVFMALRKRGVAKPGLQPIYHAVTPHCRIALCATEPGNRSGWAEPPAPDVTCLVCIRRLTKL